MSTQKNNVMHHNGHGDHLVEEERIAHLSAMLLNDHAQHLSATTLQRLAEARGFAVNQLATSQGVIQSGNVLQWIGNGFSAYVERHKMMSAAMMIGAMLFTFFAIQKLNIDKNLESSDAFLLASELPPEAFADKGFDTWLVSKRD